MNQDKMWPQQRIWIFMCAIVLLIPLTYAEVRRPVARWRNPTSSNHRESPQIGPRANPLRSWLKNFLLVHESHADEVISLDEHLRSLNETEGQNRSVSKQSDCDTVCGLPPPLDLKATCTRRKWVPNFVENRGCECLTEYRCCDDQCPMADLTSCWKKGKKGQQFGIMEIDCCGCNVTKCVKCPSTLTRSEVCPRTGKLRKCYDYSNTETHENVSGCFLATCEEKPSDAPADETCDPKCQKTIVKKTECDFHYNKCEATKVIENCTLYQRTENIKLLPNPEDCYHNTPTKVDDDVESGYFEDSSSMCKKCYKWNYSPKSCTKKNLAANQLSCHKHGADQKDKKCFQKKVSPDSCGCDQAQCMESSAAESDEFGRDDVCPLNHLKISGVSICMKARDICKRCPPLTKLNKPTCTYGQVVETKDSIGCPRYECKLATIPEVHCPLDTYKLEKNTNQLTCKRCPPLTELTPPTCTYGQVVETKDSIGCLRYVCKLATIPEVHCPSDTYKLDKNTNQLTCKSLLGIHELKYEFPAASTFYSKNFLVKDAFVLNPTKGWVTKKNDTPAVIWYCFQEEHRPKNISFRPVDTTLEKAEEYQPKKFEFVGKVKPGDSWEVLCEGTEYAEYKSLADERGCEISKQIDHGFQCLGIRITQRTKLYSGLRRIRMWGYN